MRSFAWLSRFLPFPTFLELKALPWVIKKQYQLLPPNFKRALLVSFLVHLLIIGLRFVPEDVFSQWDKQAIQVVLVNASSDVSPKDVQAQVVAQSTLMGGGEALSGLVKSPLPDLSESKDGDALVAAQRQVQMLERQQAELMAALKSSLHTSSKVGTNRIFNPKPGTAQDNTTEAFMRQVAVLDKQVQDYNAKPKRKQLSPATKEAVFATYYAQWSDRLERLGTENYPVSARGLSGEVVVTVSIRPNGKLESVEVMRGSGNKVLDRAAMRLLQMLAPYQPFTGELKERVDILDITTRLIFTPAQTVEAETLIDRK